MKIHCHTFLFTVLSVLVLTSSITRAATATWADGAGDDLWSSTLNWSAGTSPTGNDIVFSNTGTSPTSGTITSIIDAAHSINSLSFNNTSGYHSLYLQPATSLSIVGSLNLNNGITTFLSGTGVISTSLLQVYNGTLSINQPLLDVASTAYIGYGGDNNYYTGILNLLPGASLKIGSASTPAYMCLGYKTGRNPATITGTFSPNSSLNPNIELYLSQLQIGYNYYSDGAGTGIGTMDLTNYTGVLAISGALNVGNWAAGVGHFTFGNATNNLLSVPAVNIYNGDLNVNNGATLNATSSLYIGHGSDNSTTGVLNLLPGAGLKVGSAASPANMYLGYKTGRNPATVIGTFSPNSLLNPNIELYLSQLQIGYNYYSDGAGTGIGTMDLTNYTGVLAISGALNVGNWAAGVGHFTFGNATNNLLSVPAVNIYNGDLNVNNGATLNVTNSMTIGHGSDNSTTGVLNLLPGAGLKMGTPAAPAYLCLGYKSGRNPATVTGTFSPNSSLNPNIELYLSQLDLGYDYYADGAGTGIGTMDLTNYTGVLAISGALNVGNWAGGLGHFTVGCNNTQSLSTINIINGDLKINPKSAMKVTSSLYVNSTGTININICDSAGGLVIENASASALSISSTTNRMLLTFDNPNFTSDAYWGLLWKGDHKAQLKQLLDNQTIVVDLIGTLLNEEDLTVSMININGADYTYIGFDKLSLVKNPCTQLAGDVNHDCIVNLADLSLLASQWLAEDKSDPILNGMTWITIRDAGISGQHGFVLDIGKYEITNAQYCQFLNAALASGDIVVNDNVVYGANGLNGGQDYTDKAYIKTNAIDSQSQITYANGIFSPVIRNNYDMADHPVVKVSWYGASAFCNYYRFKLPTEPQWQGAADYTGSYTYGCGMSIDSTKANHANANPLGLSSYPYTTPVGYYSGYGYGFCDIAGNVREWTSTKDSSDNVITCGGGWSSIDSACTVASSLTNNASSTDEADLGFRVCR